MAGSTTPPWIEWASLPPYDRHWEVGTHSFGETGSSMASNDSRLASIVGEWRSRLDAGEELDPEQVIEANPDLADELRVQFRALSRMRRAAASKKASTQLRTLPIDRYGEFKPAGEGGNPPDRR